MLITLRELSDIEWTYLERGVRPSMGYDHKVYIKKIYFRGGNFFQYYIQVYLYNLSPINWV